MQLSEVDIPAGAVDMMSSKYAAAYAWCGHRSWSIIRWNVAGIDPQGRKRCLLPSGFGERNLAVPLDEVQVGEVVGWSEPLDQFIDPGHRVGLIV